MESDEPSSKKLHDLLELFNLIQHVHEPTHIMGHTIDIVITNKDESLINNLRVTQFDLSHHFLVDFSFNAQVKQVHRSKSISFRSIRNVNMERFREDVENGLASACDSRILSTSVQNYNMVLHDIVNKHAPLKQRTIKIVDHAPWFDDEYASLRRCRRRAERKYRNTKSDADKHEYNTIKKQCISMAESKKTCIQQNDGQWIEKSSPRSCERVTRQQ